MSREYGEILDKIDKIDAMNRAISDAVEIINRGGVAIEQPASLDAALCALLAAEANVKAAQSALNGDAT